MTATDLVSAIIDRAAIHSRLLRLQPIATWRRRSAEARRAAFHPSGPIGEASAALANAVTEHGHQVLDSAGVLIGSAQAVIDSLVAGGSRAWRWRREDAILESEDILIQAPSVYMLGLDPALLDAAEHYLGEPCYYMGCSLKRELVSPSQAGARQWHLDIEDDRMLRLIVYLTDVGPDGGPFNYIAPEDTLWAKRRMGYRAGYLDEAQMREAVPEECWHQITGAAGTVIAFDGTRLFHRAGRPTGAERLSLSITYSSRYPRQILRPVRLLPSSRRQLLERLDDRQRACIPAARWS